MTITAAQVKTWTREAETELSSRLVKLDNGLKPLSNDLLFGAAFALLAIAAIGLSNAQNLSWDMTSLIPSGLWTLAGWLGLIKDMLFKAIVTGGFLLQNRTRFVLLVALVLAIVYGLSSKARPQASKSAASFGYFELPLVEPGSPSDLRSESAWSNLAVATRNLPQCC